MGEEPNEVIFKVGSEICTMDKRNVDLRHKVYPNNLIEITDENIDTIIFDIVKRKFDSDSFNSKIEHMLSSDAKNAYNYAMLVICGPWANDSDSKLAAEVSIAGKINFAYHYAVNIMNGRWPQDTKAGIIAEMNLATDHDYAYRYARFALKGRWPQDCEAGRIAEESIAKDPQSLMNYIITCCGREWPKDFKHKTNGRNVMLADNTTLVRYASDVVKGRIEPDFRYVAEKKISENVESIVGYCSRALISQWPKDSKFYEKVTEMMKSSQYSLHYRSLRSYEKVHKNAE